MADNFLFNIAKKISDAVSEQPKAAAPKASPTPKQSPKTAGGAISIGAMIDKAKKSVPFVTVPIDTPNAGAAAPRVPNVKTTAFTAPIRDYSTIKPARAEFDSVGRALPPSERKDPFVIKPFSVGQMVDQAMQRHDRSLDMDMERGIAHPEQHYFRYSKQLFDPDPSQVTADNVNAVLKTNKNYLYDQGGQLNADAQNYIKAGFDKAKSFVIKDFGDYFYNDKPFDKKDAMNGTRYLDGFTYTALDGTEQKAYIGTLKNAFEYDKDTAKSSKFLVNFMSEREQAEYLYILGRFGDQAAESYAIDNGILQRVERQLTNELAKAEGYKYAHSNAVGSYAVRPVTGIFKAGEGLYNWIGNAASFLTTGNANSSKPLSPSGNYWAAFHQGMNMAQEEALPGWAQPLASGGNMLLENLAFTYAAGAMGGAPAEFSSELTHPASVASSLASTYNISPSSLTTGLGIFGQSYDDNYYNQILTGTADKPGAFLSATVKSGLQALSFNSISQVSGKLFGRLGAGSTGVRRILINLAEASFSGAGINAAQAFLRQVADTVIRGPYSDFALAKNELLSQGYSETDAALLSFYNTAVKPTMESAVSGGLISAFHAFPHSVADAMSFSQYGSKVRNGGYDYIADGLRFDDSTTARKFAEKLQKRADEGKYITDNMIGVAAYLNELEHARRGEYVQTINDLTGLKVYHGNIGEDSSARLDDSSIFVSDKAEHGADNAIRHELGHWVERLAPEEFSVFRDLLSDADGYANAITRIKDNYRRAYGNEMSDRAAEAELAADYSMNLGKLPELERISRLVNERPSAADRVHSSLTWLASKLDGRTLVDEATGLRLTGKQAAELARAYENAFISAVSNAADGAAAEGETQYSTRTALTYGISPKDEVRKYTADKAVDKEFRQYKRLTVSDLVQKAFDAFESGDKTEGNRLLIEGGEIIREHMRNRQNSDGIAADFAARMYDIYTSSREKAILEASDINSIRDIDSFGLSVGSIVLGLQNQRVLDPDLDTHEVEQHIRDGFTLRRNGADDIEVADELRKAAYMIVAAEYVRADDGTKSRAYSGKKALNQAAAELVGRLNNAYTDSQRASADVDPKIIAADNAKYHRSIEGAIRDIREDANLREGEARGLSELTRRSIDYLFSGETDFSVIREDINKTISELTYGHGHSDHEIELVTKHVLDNVFAVSAGLLGRKKASLQSLINSETAAGRENSPAVIRATAELNEIKRSMQNLTRFNDSLNVDGKFVISKLFLNTLMNPFNALNQEEMISRVDEFTYQQRINVDMYHQARREILERGLEPAYNDVINKSAWTEVDNIKAFILANEFARMGRTTEAVDLQVVQSKRDRAAGRLVQSNMVAKQMTIAGRILKFDQSYREGIRSQYEFMKGKEAVKDFDKGFDHAQSIDRDRQQAADDALTRQFEEHREAKDSIREMGSDMLEISNDIADNIAESGDTVRQIDTVNGILKKNFGDIQRFFFFNDSDPKKAAFNAFSSLMARLDGISDPSQRSQLFDEFRASYDLPSHITNERLLSYGRWQRARQKARFSFSESDGTTAADTPNARFQRGAAKANSKANERDRLLSMLYDSGLSKADVNRLWNENGKKLDAEWVFAEVQKQRLRREGGLSDAEINTLIEENGGNITGEWVDTLLNPDASRYDSDADHSSELPDLDETEVQSALAELEGLYKRAAELDAERFELEDRSGEIAAMLQTANADMLSVIEGAMMRIQDGAGLDNIAYNELAHVDTTGLNYAIDAYLKRAKVGYLPQAEINKIKTWMYKIEGAKNPEELIDIILDLSGFRHTATQLGDRFGMRDSNGVLYEHNRGGLYKKLMRVYEDFEVKTDPETGEPIGSQLDILKDIAFQQTVGAMTDRTMLSRAKKARSLHFAVQLLGVPTFLRNIGSEVFMGIPESVVNDVAAAINTPYAFLKTGLQTGLRMLKERSSAADSKRTVGDVKTETFGERFKNNRLFGFEIPGYGMPSRLKAANKRARESFLETALNVNLIGRDRTRFGKDIAYKRSFTKGPGAVMERMLGYSLSVTDEWLKGYYHEQVRQSLKHTGLTDKEIEAEAKLAADYRVFQNDTVVGITLEMLRKAANNIGIGPKDKNGFKEFGLGDLITTYTFVPGAVATRAFEYTPLGAAKAIYMTYRMFTQADAAGRTESATAAAEGRKLRFSERFKPSLSNMTANGKRQALLAILRPMAGTGMIYLGSLLRSKGIIIGTSQTSGYAEDMYEKAKNLGDFRINISQLLRLINGEADDDLAHDGDLISDMGWITPLNTTLSIGADLYDKMGDAGFSINSNEFWSNLLTSNANISSEALEDLAMWSSINSISKNAKNTSSVPEFAAAQGADFLFSFWPSILRQTAAGLDKYERDPYKSSSVGELFVNKVRANIPIAREGVPIAVDIFGQARERTIGNRTLDFFNSAVLPSRLYRYKENALTDELDRLVKQDPKVLPSTPYRHQEFELDGQKYTLDLSGDNYTKYGNMQGMLSYKIMSAFVNDPDFDRLSDSMKIDIFRDINTDIEYRAARKIWVGYMSGKGEYELSEIERELIDKYKNAATNRILNAQAQDYLNQDGVNVEDVINTGYYENYTASEKSAQIADWRSYIQKINAGTFYDKSRGGQSRYWSAEDRTAKIAEYERRIADLESGATQKWHTITGAFSGLSDKDKAQVLKDLDNHPDKIHLPDDIKEKKPDFSKAGAAVIDVSNPLVDWQPMNNHVGGDVTKWDTRDYDKLVEFEREQEGDSWLKKLASGFADSVVDEASESEASGGSSGGYSRARRWRNYSSRRRYSGGRSRPRNGSSRLRLGYINGSGAMSLNGGYGGGSRFAGASAFGGNGGSRFAGASAFGAGDNSRRVGYINVH